MAPKLKVFREAPPADAVEEKAFFAEKETTSLPEAPRGKRVCKIRFTNCPGEDLHILCVQEITPPDAKYGVVGDGWWVIRCKNIPDRTVRLFEGAHSLLNLVRRYGFQDSSGCVNHQRMKIVYVPTSTACAPHNLAVPHFLRDSKGVPQFYLRSGVCWFATLCWTSFANPKMHAFLRNYFPSECHAHIDACLHDRDHAEKLRRFLWHTYAVGDDVDDRPENDGKNGFREFMVLCAKLAIPLLVYRERTGVLQPVGLTVQDQKGQSVKIKRPSSADADHLLVLRFNGADHEKKFPLHRRLFLNGKKYRLVGLYMGQAKCGHQIGLVSPTGDWHDWCLGDADLHKDGIGPIFICFGEEWKDCWWEAWRVLVHVTKYGPRGDQFCPFSPLNVPDGSLDQYKGTGGPGSNNIDAIYASFETPRK